MTDKEIAYFIMTYSTLSEDKPNSFIWPVLPNPEMGEEFISRIKKQFDEIQIWIFSNPKKFKAAEYGYYFPDENDPRLNDLIDSITN